MLARPPGPLDPDPVSAALRGLIRAVVAEVLSEVQATGQAPAGETYYDARTAPCGRRTFLAAARRGDFPSSKVGRRVLATRADVDDWIRSRVRTPPPARFDPGQLLAANGIVPTAARVRR